MLNKFETIGYLGSDPKFWQGHGDKKSVAVVNIATSDKVNGKETTEWNRCVFFGRSAEIVNEYCHKGSMLFVSGKLVTKEYEDKQGNKRKDKEVLVAEFYMFKEVAKSETTTETKPAKATHRAPAYDEEGAEMMDDLPF